MKGILLLLFAVPLATPIPTVATTGGLSVVSLNLARETNAGRILADLAKVATVRNADIFLLQEAVHSDSAVTGIAGELANALNMNVVAVPAGPGVYDQGLAILSRYPISDRSVRALKKCDLRFRSRERFALAVTVLTPAGPVRIWNVHLDTRINSIERLEQLAPVLVDARAVPGPKIIGGDFNTNSFYWLGNVLPLPWVEDQGESIRRHMSAAGFTAPFQAGRATFDYLKMHLDWIYQQNLEVREAAVYPMLFSDHHALLLRFGT
jgi:endonuclease/exonuclease/phosphatase family metal-dependent hydrolase